MASACPAKEATARASRRESDIFERSVKGGSPKFTACFGCRWLRLAESPNDSLRRELRQLCCLRCRLDCSWVEANQFPGPSCTRCSPAPFTAHCYVNNETV